MNNIEKIEQAKLVITMIEADDINYNEINARVWCLGEEFTFKSMGLNSTFKYSFCGITSTENASQHWVKRVATSLDACQSIMLEGWYVLLKQDYLFDDIYCEITNGDVILKSNSPTMPLAWLHAILQSYIWEWENE